MVGSARRRRRLRVPIAISTTPHRRACAMSPVKVGPDDTRRLRALRVTIRFGSSESYIAAGRGCFGHNSRGRRWRGSSYLDVNAVVQSRTRVLVSASCDRSAAHRGCGHGKLTENDYSQWIQPSIILYSHSLYVSLPLFPDSPILTPSIRL